VAPADSTTAGPAEHRGRGDGATRRARRVRWLDDNVDSAADVGMCYGPMGPRSRVAPRRPRGISAAARERRSGDLDIGLAEVRRLRLRRLPRRDTHPEDVRLIALTGFGTERDRDTQPAPTA